MSKIIRITDECLEEVRRDFESALKDAKIADGKISFTKTFTYVNRKATVYFTEVAWLKMQTLIREFDTEIGWHGVAYRDEDIAKDAYYITDILVYPQKVSGATVNTDQKPYEMWLMDKDDETFNNMRMHGHSHVNMSTSPSGVDTTHQEEILDRLDDDMFYIFMIWNKRGEKSVKIYDLLKNVLFDGNDVTVEIKDDTHGLNTFLTEAKDMVTRAAPAVPAPAQTFGKSYGSPNPSKAGTNTFMGKPESKFEDGKKKGKRKVPVGEADMWDRYDYSPYDDRETRDPIWY